MLDRIKKNSDVPAAVFYEPEALIRPRKRVALCIREHRARAHS